MIPMMPSNQPLDTGQVGYDGHLSVFGVYTFAELPIVEFVEVTVGLPEPINHFGPFSFHTLFMEHNLNHNFRLKILSVLRLEDVFKGTVKLFLRFFLSKVGGQLFFFIL